MSGGRPAKAGSGPPPGYRVFAYEDGLIREIFIQVNPEKLPERT